MEGHTKTEDVLRRLAKINGQLKGIISMVEKGRACEDVIVQISSAKAALHNVGYIMLEDHLEHCIPYDIKNGNETAAIASLKKALSQFSKML